MREQGYVGRNRCNRCQSDRESTRYQDRHRHNPGRWLPCADPTRDVNEEQACKQRASSVQAAAAVSTHRGFDRHAAKPKLHVLLHMRPRSVGSHAVSMTGTVEQTASRPHAAVAASHL